MKLIESYNIIQWLIVKEMIRLLQVEKGQSVDEWKEEKLGYVADLNTFTIDALVMNNHQVMQAVQSEYDEAYRLISEHMQEQFNLAVEQDDEQLQLTIDYINRDIIRSLYSTRNRKGIVQKTYEQIIDDVIESDEDDLETALEVVLIATLSNGLDSGFKQINGVTWKMDRTVSQISKHIFQELYKNAYEQLQKSDIELVRVFKYAKPRDACRKLQESGIIGIKPRHTMSIQNQVYPNVWDAEHHFLEPAGHSGRNCRHAWHSINAHKDNTDKLFNPIDETILMVEQFRLKYRALLQRNV